MFLGFFSKSKSSAIDLETQRSPLLLSRFKTTMPWALQCPNTTVLICNRWVLQFELEKEKGACRAPICQTEVEILLGLNQCQGLKGTKHQLILHTGRKCWGTSYFLFSYVASQTWQQEMLLNLHLAATLIAEIISFYNGLHQKWNKSENIKRHKGQ